MRGRPVRRWDDNDAIDWCAGGDVLTVLVKKTGQQCPDDFDVFGNERLAAVQAALVTREPVAQIGRLAVQRDQVQRQCRDMQFRDDLCAIPTLVIVWLIVPRAAAPARVGLSILGRGHKLRCDAVG